MQVCAAHFCGRMFASAFEEEIRLKAEVDAVLESRRIDAGFGALACGADILIAEVLLRRAQELHVILPFAIDRFAATSVRIGGPSWEPRYQACLQAATAVQVLDMDPAKNPFGQASKVAMHAVRRRDPQAIQVALFDGMETEAKIGTVADINHWRSLGGETVVVETPPSLRLPPAERQDVGNI